MKKCFDCKGIMAELEGIDPNGFKHKYYKCKKCGDEVLDMKQLHELAEKYRKMKRYNTKISKWGLSLGVRIPKELAKKYSLKDKEDVYLLPEKDGIRIVPA